MRTKHLPAVLLAGLALMPGSGRAMGLSEAVHLAVEHDPTVPMSLARLAADSEQGRQERAELLPNLSVSGSGRYTDSDSQFAFGSARDTFPSWSAYLNARQALLRLDWRARLRRADVKDRLAKENQRDREVQFVVRVSLRWLDTLLAEDRLEQAQSEARAVRESLQDTRKRYDVQLVPGTDLKEAQARDDLAQAELVAAGAALEDYRDALQEVTGYDRAPLPRLRDETADPALDPTSLDGWIALAGSDSSEARQARMAVELARTELASRKAEALPSADLVGSVGRNDSSEYALGQRQDDAHVGVELSVPLYAGGINRSRVNQAAAELRYAESDLRRVEMETERGVRTSYRALQTARAEARAYDQAYQSALLAESATRAGYDAGTRTISDVLDARSRVVQARGNRNAARYTSLIRYLELHAAAGRLTEAEVQRIDELFVPREAAP